MSHNQSNLFDRKLIVISPNVTLDLIFANENYAFSDKHFYHDFVERPGGSGINIARALTDLELGSRVKLITILGGHAGEHIKNLFKDEELDVVVTYGNATTRTTAIQYCKTNKNMAVAPSPYLAENEIKSLLENAANQIRSNDLVFFGGSIHASKKSTDLLVSFLNQYRERLIIDTRGIILESILAGGPLLCAKIDLSDIDAQKGVKFVCLKHKIQCHCEYLKKFQIGLAIFESYDHIHAVIQGERDPFKWPQFGTPSHRPYGRGDAFMAGIVSWLLRNKRFQKTDLVNAVESGITAGRCYGNVLEGLGSIDNKKLKRYSSHITSLD